MVLIDCSVLAQHWRQLQSLHISYTALPESADSHLTCLAGFEGLKNLSIYCFQQGGGQQVSPDTRCLTMFDRV
jgi:hypothetical protein